MSEKRRHAAIMFTDIVGFTALMGSDEEKAFALLARNRKLHQQIIKKYNGSVARSHTQRSAFYQLPVNCQKKIPEGT